MRAPTYKATITAKGQITIPKFVREQLVFQPGDRVEITVNQHDQSFVGVIQRPLDVVQSEVKSDA